VRSAVWLRGSARHAVHLLKYESWWRVAEALAEAMVTLEPLTGQVCLIPVPLGSRRLRTRGYNQSERIARALGARVGRPVRTEVLQRRRETRTQTALTPEGRHANVAGAFEARGAAGLACVLVDDVFTTGATLAAAGAALQGAGAARVEAVTFARAEPPVSLG
jgi:predicted amidophosphoribosyltransferase